MATHYISRIFIGVALFTMLAGVLMTPIATYAASDADATGNAVDPSEAPPAAAIDSAPKVLAVLQRITNWMFTIFIAVAAMMIIFAAFTYLTSEGGEGVEKAHKMILYSAIAIVVATASRGLVTLVRNFITETQ